MQTNFLKTLVAVFALLMGTGNAWADTKTIYSWISTGSDASGVTETGGTAAGKIGPVNTKDNVLTIYSMMLADKPAALKDASNHVVITLTDETFKEGDKITVKGYYSKDAAKTTSLAIMPGNVEGGPGSDGKGVNMSSVAGIISCTDTDWPNLFTATEVSSTTHEYALTSAFNGKNAITLTRNISSTNLNLIEVVITREVSEGGEVEPEPEPETPGEEEGETAKSEPLLWDYSESAPASTADNGLTMAATVNDAAGTKNGLKGVKLNSGGYAYFTKKEGPGTLKLTFGPRSGTASIALDIFTFSSEPKDETLIYTTKTVNELQTVSIPLSAKQNNIYIKRTAASSEGVLTKIQFTPARAFKDFEIDLVSLSTPFDTSVLPAGVEMSGSNRGDSHGYNNFALTVPVDGAVKFTIGGCQYNTFGATVKNSKGETIATVDAKTSKCYHQDHATNIAEYIYKGGEDVLTITGPEYTPYFKAEAVEIAKCSVTYKDQNGNVLGSVEKEEGDQLGEVPYSASNLTIAEGNAFRGWFYSNGVKVKSTDLLNGNTTISARVTPIETVEVNSVQNYDFTTATYYPEDHETITTEGTYYHDNQHGWAFADGGKVSVQVAGNAQIIYTLCVYSKEDKFTVTDAKGNELASTIGYVGTDGTTFTVLYEGEPTTITATYSKGESYLHGISVYNVKDFITKSANGYYMIPAGDAASLVLAINSAVEGDKIFLPNGTYDLGESVLTTISANNVSIIGESMDETIIRNAPAKEKEGIGTTATLLNTSDGLYLQDLTLQNALDYYALSTGRAVCLQDKGKNTICKNVKLLSYQDTYYSNSANNFYWEDSEIHGTVDYLCGDGDVVYNRVKLVNESREKTAGKGDCTICAPYQSASCQWGYVFLDCTVETKSASFNLGRSWGGESKAQYINTTILEPSKLASSRFTTKGMNVAAYKFGEYNTLDASGNVISPASNILTFTHTSGDKTYETILSDADAANYTIDNIFGTWAPDQIAAQVELTEENLYSSDNYLVTIDGKPAIIAPEDLNTLVDAASAAAGSVTVRAANARGGFGAAFTYTPIPTAINATPSTDSSSVNGKFLKNGSVIIRNNGKQYSAAGVETK